MTIRIPIILLKMNAKSSLSKKVFLTMEFFNGDDTDYYVERRVFPFSYNERAIEGPSHIICEAIGWRRPDYADCYSAPDRGLCFKQYDIPMMKLPAQSNTIIDVELSHICGFKDASPGIYFFKLQSIVNLYNAPDMTADIFSSRVSGEVAFEVLE